ncbi:replicative DNA helicase [Kitasatospora sp. NPDC058063]|uniref:replicative DNA helicase n=1 Tax=unclassified Kitasatospora TaxID=2633591 RepID=UPI0036DA6CBD
MTLPGQKSAAPAFNDESDWSNEDGPDPAAADPLDNQPHDLTAEQEVIGAMLTSADAIATVSQILRPRDYHRPAHEKLHRVIVDMYASNRRVTPITVADELRDRKIVLQRSTNDASYLHACVAAVTTATGAEESAHIVRKHARRRAIITETLAVMQAGRHGDPAKVIESAMAAFQALATGVANTEVEKLSVADRLEDYLDKKQRGDNSEIIASPWPDLNEVLKVKPGMFGTVGAATSGGKSLFAQTWANYVALKLDKPVLFGSLEMTGEELMDRMVADQASVLLHRLAEGGDALTDDDWFRISQQADVLGRAHNFVLDDTANLTLSRLRARIRQMDAQGRKPALVVVDYLQLMPADEGQASPVRAQEVAAISRGLKLLAMEFDTAVIALAQFNREAKNRRPQATDFKESSAIEQDSNFIILLHTELDEENQPVRPGEVEVILAKNRNGVKNRILPMAMLGHYGRIAQMPKDL